MNGAVFDNYLPCKIFVATIISSIYFAVNIHHFIVLCYLLVVLRLLCLLYGNLTGEKIGLPFRLINWQLTL